MQLVRAEFSTKGLLPDEKYLEHARINTHSGVPFIELRPAHGIPLAIVGGGPSAGAALAELQQWPGHIWAVNQGASWLSHAAPKADVWMFSVDPDPVLAEPFWTVGVQKAILGSTCSPNLVNYLRLSGKEVRIFNPHEYPADEDRELVSGPSSVTRAFIPAACLGYQDITFFGCEGSLEGELDADGYYTPRTHAYRTEPRKDLLIVRCGEGDFITTPDLYLTTRHLAGRIREYPKALKEKSGGLLRGMLKHWDSWHVVAWSESLRDRMDPSATNRYMPRMSAKA